MRLHFSIRDLLWLTVVVALAVGWWLDRTHLVSLNRYTVTKSENGSPTVIKDNVTGEFLVHKFGDTWVGGWWHLPSADE
jgi:hypothetical protein